MSKVRVLRVIEYIGEYEDIIKQLSKSSIPNNGEKTYNGVTMRSGLVGDIPEMLEENIENNQPSYTSNGEYANYKSVVEELPIGVQSKINLITE